MGTNEQQLALALAIQRPRGEARTKEMALGSVGLSVLVEQKVIDGESRWGEPAKQWPKGTKFELLRVMHDAAGGEVRGYMLRGGVAYLRSPCYTGTWEAVDEAISRLFGCTIAPYEITSGRIVQYSPRAS